MNLKGVLAVGFVICLAGAVIAGIKQGPKKKATLVWGFAAIVLLVGSAVVPNNQSA